MELHSEREQQAMAAMLESHVRAYLKEIWQVDDVTADDDGDYCYRWGTAVCWVSPRSVDGFDVRVFGYAVQEVKPSAKLLAELNDLNQRLRHARVFVERGGRLPRAVAAVRHLHPVDGAVAQPVGVAAQGRVGAPALRDGRRLAGRQAPDPDPPQGTEPR
jgi:hypothetical protein